MLCGRVRRGIKCELVLSCDSSDLDDILAYLLERRNCVSGREQDVVGLHRLRNGAVELGAGALCSDVADRRGHSALFEASANVGAEVVRAFAQVVEVYLRRFREQDSAGYAYGVVERGDGALLDIGAETLQRSRPLAGLRLALRRQSGRRSSPAAHQSASRKFPDRASE